MDEADGPAAAIVRLHALPARLRAVVSEGVRQGAATALAAAEIQFGAAMEVRVVDQAFPPEPDDPYDMDDLFESCAPCANAVLAKVNVDEILHARLDP